MPSTLESTRPAPEAQLTFSAISQDDFSAWRTLWLEYVGAHRETMAPHQHTLTFSRLCAPEVNLWGVLARCGQQPVGFAHFQWQYATFSPEPSCYLEDLFVTADARGHGVARAVLEEVRRIAGCHGAQTMHWKTREDNVAAQRLYDRFAERTNYLTYRTSLV
ncbi:GNAT family N-acetyltransferase [Niveibacterium sp.]|uniref:GNAT family N-acetyltransferase n=1 Tax=Niveibacterium sp. TaxID=2017444 RepID=UPI0035B10E51